MVTKDRWAKPCKLLICLLLTSEMWAEKKAPPMDDPEVHYSFFFFMDGFGQWLDARIQADPSRKTKLMESAGRYLKIDPAELPGAITLCRTAVAELKAIQAQAEAYWRGETKNGNNPDKGHSQQFEAMRQTSIQAGRVRLQQSLSVSSWTGLQSHINGEHRLKIQSFR